ncbi:MAG: outer membrane lipoprotein-sorting protein, partial [Mariprofundaceae bacterium]|nr:outer membrane lipoprotein-sorting protein [Mariprofundaceae bacterium]
PASMMLSSWMGSDFTNDDLVKMDSVVEDYNHSIIAKDEHSITIESTAKPDAPVVWGKIVHVVNDSGIPLSDDYYDEHGTHIRHLAFSEVRMMDGRRIPTLWSMQPLNGKGKKTLLKLEEATFDKPIAEYIFTRANLRRASSRR